MGSLSDVRVRRKISWQKHISVWLSMMSGHGANPIFFIKNNKDWTSRTLDNPHPLRPIISHFCLTFPHPLKVDAICVSPLHEPVCYKNPENTSCIDLILTNSPRSFEDSCVVEAGLSDFHRIVVTIIKITFDRFLLWIRNILTQ